MINGHPYDVFLWYTDDFRTRTAIPIGIPTFNSVFGKNEIIDFHCVSKECNHERITYVLKE